LIAKKYLIKLIKDGVKGWGLKGETLVSPYEGYFFPYIKQTKTTKFNNIGIEIECKKLY
jgi:hypothetical protein